MGRRQVRSVRRRTASLLLTVALAAGGLAVVTTSGAAAVQPFAVTSLSNPRAELVSGGQVLVGVEVPEAADPDAITVTRNGVDVTSVFVGQADGSRLGLVTGLDVGPNRIVATLGDGTAATLRVRNHPISGPVLSGPQQVPFFCETQAFGLPPATQPLCSAPTQVSYRYRTTAGTFAVLTDPSARPPDLAFTTVGGVSVPYIVRLERGTIDRAVYEIAALHDGSDPDPVGPDTSWNGRLVYTFGGGCNGGYHQGASTGGVLNDLFLAQGYGVASSSLNVLNNNCSTIISAEAAMMVKEHFIESYGPTRFTIGWGGSGGAIQQYDIADAYPGILDGIIPGISFPDPNSTLGPVVDCRLLNRYFASTDPAYSEAQKAAVSGFGSYHVCTSWDITFANRATATDSCDPAVPVAARWDPVTNPDGVKCAAIEQVANQLGRDPATGFVRSPLDNVGVQYGLAALEEGVIDAEQFVEINERIGGLDVVGDVVAARSVADPKALAAVYRTDLLNSGGLGLARTPVIDHRTYLDNIPTGFADIHTAEWSYVMRERMIEQGTVANQVIIESSPLQTAAVNAYVLDAMDRWLTNIAADTSGGPFRARVARNRPADLGDGCYLADGTRILEPLSYGAPGRCASLYPVFSNTRLVAGEPLTRDVLKCALAPIDFGAYPVTFTAEQQARLTVAFPDGVCDYGRRGVRQRPPIGPWLTY
ncbi:MAG: DUF6351 family protein [Acidimicrobiales bacterium]